MNTLIAVLFGITTGCIVLCLAILIRLFLLELKFDKLVKAHNSFVQAVINGEINNENNE